MDKIDDKQLEQWVEKVHRLLEVDGAKVKWNQFIRDPDNPAKKRQVDVTIEANGVITHVECRAHKTPQDVKWIEELMGRRQSLCAQGMIAVSTSGFTEGARRKARRYGILLRTMSELSDKEVQSWTSRACISMRWLQVTELEICMEFHPQSSGRVTADDVEEEIRSGELLRTVLDLMSNNIDTNKDDDMICSGKMHASVDMDISGQAAHGLEIRFKAGIYEEGLRIPIVMSYVDIDGDSTEVAATIGCAERQGIELVRADDAANMILDLTSVDPPGNCHMIGPALKFDSEVTLKSLQVLNMMRPPVSIDQMKVGVAFRPPFHLRGVQSTDELANGASSLR